MTVPPMRPWQNFVALAATVFLCGALLPLAPRVRIACAAFAFLVILALFALRMRTHAVRRDDARVGGVYDRIARIRAERTKGRER